MKNIFALAAICSFMSLSAQNIGVNAHGQIPHPSAILDVSDSGSVSRKGVLLTRMNTVARNSITNPALGLIVVDTVTWCLSIYTDTGWVDMCPSMPSSSPCPPGMVDMGIYSIEYNQRGPLEWYQAADTCLELGMRLCDVDQWTHAYVVYTDSLANGTVILGGMDNEHEWMNENGVGNYMRIQGYPNFQSSTEVFFGSGWPFRCCCEE